MKAQKTSPEGYLASWRGKVWRVKAATRYELSPGEWSEWIQVGTNTWVRLRDVVLYYAQEAISAGDRVVRRRMPARSGKCICNRGGEISVVYDGSNKTMRSGRSQAYRSEQPAEMRW